MPRPVDGSAARRLPSPASSTGGPHAPPRRAVRASAAVCGTPRVPLSTPRPRGSSAGRLTPPALRARAGGGRGGPCGGGPRRAAPAPRWVVLTVAALAAPMRAGGASVDGRGGGGGQVALQEYHRTAVAVCSRCRGALVAARRASV